MTMSNQPVSRSESSHRWRGPAGALLVLALLAPASGAAAVPVPASAAPDAPVPASAAPAASSVPVVSPQPQHIEATGGRPVVITGKKVHVIVDDDVDVPTRDLVLGVLEDAGAYSIELLSPTDPVEGKAPVTVRVGALATADIAEELADMDVNVPSDVPPEGYVIGVQGNPLGSIVLAGVDGDGTYYAAQTLRQLVYAQDGDSRIPGVEVVDYPSMPLRGSIEGFYGAPWSHEDRLDQMRFYSHVKMNTYIYAPKDDPYHRDLWREPYPPDLLAELEELVMEATANHVRFTFALSPGAHQPAAGIVKICFTSEDDWDALIAKLQAMYEVGVRAFNIPFDDIPLNSWSCASDQDEYGSAFSQANQARAQAEFLNRVQEEFLDSREGTYPLQMTPTHYEGTADTVYRQNLRANLQQGIEVMWTGMATVPPNILISDADDIATVYGRKAFVWDNYPVNDFGTPGRLHLGPYQKREAGLSAHLTGIVLNPMNQAAASKVALFTAADFLWNEFAYDFEHSWRQSASYLAGDDEETIEALLTFFDLNHLAPTFGSSPWLPQAPELAASIADFWSLWDAGDGQAAVDGIRPHATAIAEAPDIIRAGVADPIFQADVERWLLATDLWSQAFHTSLAAAEAQLAGDDEAADALFNQARDEIEQASLIPTDPRPRPQGTIRLADGVLDVFLTNLRDPCTREDAPDTGACPVNVAVGKPATQSSTGFGGVPERAVDGNTNGNWGAGSVTHTAEDGSPEPWWQADLEEEVPIHSVHLWNRTDCCSERLSDSYVLISSEPFTSDSLAETLAQPGVTAFHEPSTAGTPTSIFADHLDLTGRYVRVQLVGNAPLSLAEVEVLSHGSG
jgi:hyaluronoglucosaminidase